MTDMRIRNVNNHLRYVKDGKVTGFSFPTTLEALIAMLKTKYNEGYVVEEVVLRRRDIHIKVGDTVSHIGGNDRDFMWRGLEGTVVSINKDDWTAMVDFGRRIRTHNFMIGSLCVRRSAPKIKAKDMVALEEPGKPIVYGRVLDVSENGEKLFLSILQGVARYGVWVQRAHCTKVPITTQVEASLSDRAGMYGMLEDK